MKVVVLHTELAGYTIACLRALGRAGHAVVVVHWPVAGEAPFNFDDQRPFSLVQRANFSASWLADQQADLVLMSGWVDRGYVQAVRAMRRTGRSRCVICLDNHWTGSTRQRLGALWFKLSLRRHLDGAWVPGAPQQRFAKRLGFDKSAVKKGYYSADVAKFLGAARTGDGAQKRLIYIGRYVPSKGLDSLWDAFEVFSQKHPSWTLHCFGTGSSWAERRQHPQIVHHGFVQPEKFREHLAGATGFVMPSLNEPWGVALHEMAAAGLPLIASDAVGAAEKFIAQGENGWVFPAGDPDEIQSCLERLSEVAGNPAHWQSMAATSIELASKLTPEKWAETAVSFV